MSLTLDDNPANYQIRAFTPGLIKINEQTLNKSLIISSSQLIENWRPQTITDLTKQDLDIALQLEPTVLIIGTGEKLLFPNIEIYGELINSGVGVEIMDTSAACRTYNILTAENRNVVAALIIR